MRGEALCLLTPCSSLPKPESARTQLSSAQCRDGWPNITRSVLADASSEATCLRFDAGTTQIFLSASRRLTMRTPELALSLRRVVEPMGGRSAVPWTMSGAAQPVCRSADWEKLFVCWSWFDMKQDASVSEPLLPSVPGSLLGRNPDHQRHQLGMLQFCFDQYQQIYIQI